ncbi:hypothetical protein Cabys_3181 [Caldithrix abyssi DSM 13497]|uniref:Uncharacterized protein n=1 Tax=Caldithrix abyssi DSM 13497 TaxID=880073 RepID=A0A1J1CCE7_CALAY|nr:hypothetical protein Cabys_3181 [Caldithrix abyssi DSM 13497]
MNFFRHINPRFFIFIGCPNYTKINGNFKIKILSKNGRKISKKIACEKEGEGGYFRQFLPLLARGRV